MLALVGQPLSRAAEPSTQGVQPLVIALQVGLQGTLQALFGLPKLAFEGVLVGYQPLGGGRRGRGAHVGGKIRQGDIHLMAHGRHHRQTGVEDGPGQVLVVERPQVFQTAAASGDQHRILGGVEPRLAVDQR